MGDAGSIGRAAPRVVALLVLFGATAVDGGTVHLSALALRIGAVVLCIAWWPRHTFSLERRWLIPVGLALAVVGLGVALAPTPGIALQSGIRVVLVCAVFFVFLRATHLRWELSLGILSSVAAIHALWAISQRLDGATRGTGGFFNPNDLAALLAPLTVFGLARALNLQGAPLPTRTRLAWIGLVVLALGGIAATGSRAGQLACAVGVLPVVGVHLLSRRRHRARIALAVAAILFAIGGLTHDRWQGRNDPEAYRRTTIWNRSAQLALAHPWGVGLGHYPHAMRPHGVPVEGPVRFAKSPRSAHSEPIHAWVELGWAGLLAVLGGPALLLGAAWHLHRRRPPNPEAPPEPSPSPDHHPATILGTLGAFAIPAAVSSSLHVPVVALGAAAWAGHVISAVVQGRTGEFSSSPSDQETRNPARATIPPWFAHPRTGAAFLVFTLALALPGAAGSFAQSRALSLRQVQDLEGASAWAQWARRLTPWSVGAALLDESLKFNRGRSALEAAEALVALGEQHPFAPEPWDRAARLMEHIIATEAPPDQGVTLWAGAAELWQQNLNRDPLNALAATRLAQAQLEAGQLEKADLTLAQLLEVEPQCAAGLALLALRAHHQDQTAQAQDLARRAWASHRLGEASQHRLDPYPRRVLALGSKLQRALEHAGLTAP